ncbi:MAG: hypothetical protein I8H76_05750 [Burkholderiales bacterium]|nr:hypothetical protein [Burkholderiales bacterium]MBH2015345.1 hypothetical protein [Burkholderiales bacterium]
MRGTLPPAARRGWNRPVRPVALVWVSAGVLLAWLALMLGATWFVYTALDVRIALRDQPVSLRLPEGMKALADIQGPIHTRLDLRPRISVPVRQTLSAEVSDSLHARVKLQATLPVQTVVHVDQVVPVRTQLQLSVPVFSWLPRFEVTVPVALALPVRMDVPVSLSVPLQLDALVSGVFREPVSVPLDAVFALRPEIHAPLQAQVRRQMAFELLAPMPPVPLVIERASLLAPFMFPSRRLPVAP